MRVDKNVSPSVWRLSWQAWLGLFALGVALWLFTTYVRALAETASILFGAIILSAVMRPVVERLERRRIPRGVTVLGFYLLLIGAFVGMGYLMLPVIRGELDSLRLRGPELMRQAFAQIETTMLGQAIPSLNVLIEGAAQRLTLLAQPLLSAVAGAGGLVIEIFILLVLAFWFVADVGLGDELLRWLPAGQQPRVRAMMGDLETSLSRWGWAQVFIAIYFAVVFTIGLGFFGIPYAFTIGLIGGVLEIIPYLGGAVAVTLAMLSALTIHPMMALWILVFYLVVVEVEAKIVSPWLFGRVIGLHPVVVLIALVIGAKLGGVLGLFFAVPAVIIIVRIIREIRFSSSPPAN